MNGERQKNSDQAGRNSDPELTELASVIRSKLAGPFRVTFDIIFRDPEMFRKVRATGAITKQSIAKLYGVPESKISSFFEVENANAIKFTMMRPWEPVFGTSDSHGAQQHIPLLTMPIPLKS